MHSAVVPVKILKAKPEQVAECAGRPPDPPKSLTTTTQPESGCNPHLKNQIPFPVLLKGCRKGKRVMS